MRKFGLMLFAFASLIVHVTAAALFVAPPEPTSQAAGAGTAAIEIGNLFDSASLQAVNPEPIAAKTPPVTQIQPTVPSQAISVKYFDQQDVQPTELKAQSPRQTRSSRTEKLTANEPLAEPDLVLPTEAKEAKTAPTPPPLKVLPVAKHKPSEFSSAKRKVAKKKPTKPVTPQKPAKKVNKNRKPAQNASRASRKGGKKASKRGHKGATGGKKGKINGANGSARVANYRSYVQGRLESRQIFPSAAKRRREFGTATVFFRIKKNGTLSDLKLIKSSGYARLDKAALATVRKSAPFKALPSFVKTNDISMVAPLGFDP